MKYILKNKEIELSEEEVQEIFKQNTTPVKEKVVGIAIKNRWTGYILFQSTKTTWKEAVEEGKEGKVNLSEADLSEADLSEAYLYGVDLSEADLSEAYLYEANLSGVDLSEANLSEANLSRANLYGANLSRANLSGANLYGAYLYEANLSEANLYGADMQNVKFIGKVSSPKTLTKKQLPDFLNALGFKIED